MCGVPRATAHHVIASDGKPSARLAVQMVGGATYELPECEVCERKWDTVRNTELSNQSVEITDLVRWPIPPRKDDKVYPGVLHTRPSDLLKQRSGPPWVVTLISDERNEANLIADRPGGSNRPHWHNNYDEWWYVAQGTLEWHLTGGKVVTAPKNDIVWVPRGTVHHIRTVGNEVSLRFAVTVPPAEHLWTDFCEVCGYRHGEG
jgi:mannose-6-phosphate isomerase-like protein (cupin superfamily)